MAFRFSQRFSKGLGGISSLVLTCIAALSSFFASTCGKPPDPPTNVPTYTYEIVNTYPHDPKAFTQGLAYHNGFLYEGTGQKGESSLRKTELETGEVLQKHDLDKRYFGEGITLLDNSIIQLTWQSQLGFVYDLETFDTLRKFAYLSEGWGITTINGRLIMSDGTSVLRYWDPETFNETAQIKVTSDGHPISQLNELEFVKGKILANIWKSNRIAEIDPETGFVTAWIDLTGILGEVRVPVDVLNGIAYDAEQDRLFVTGKYWPKLFEIRLKPLPATQEPAQ